MQTVLYGIMFAVCWRMPKVDLRHRKTIVFDADVESYLDRWTDKTGSPASVLVNSLVGAHMDADPRITQVVAVRKPAAEQTEEPCQDFQTTST